MKKILMTVAAVALSASAAFGADLKLAKAPPPPPPPPSPWDVAFGGAVMSDYIWRGITQSGHNPSVAAYTELRYNWSPSLQFYGGISAESIQFPNRAAAEVDYYGGVRPTFGPVALDFGYWYYSYPGGSCYQNTSTFNPTVSNATTPFTCNGGGPGGVINGALPNGAVAKRDWSFYEVYAKGTWTINPQWALGATYFGTPNILNTGAPGNYVSGTAKYTAPDAWKIWNAVGWYVSGEVGEQFLGTSDAFYGTGVTNPNAVGAKFQNGVRYSDYTTWNVGIGLTWKVFTFDLRYYDTSLTKSACAVYTSSQTASFNATQVSQVNPVGLQSNWCGSTVVAKLAFDLTLDSLK
jgi:uncharacterized protein (TIGR02001 family)